MSKRIQIDLPDEQASRAFAESMARAVEMTAVYQQGFTGYLEGDLGAGKSFFARHFIQYFSPEMRVKSPTYTLVETYPLQMAQQSVTVFHFDLYRLCDPEEFEFLGVREQLIPPFVAWIEWSQKGHGHLPEADIAVSFFPKNFSHGVGREAILEAFSQNGEQILLSVTN